MKCDYCNKRWMTGNKVSHSHMKSKKHQKANIQRVRALIGGGVKRVCVCTRCLRSGKVTKAA